MDYQLGRMSIVVATGFTAGEAAGGGSCTVTAAGVGGGSHPDCCGAQAGCAVDGDTYLAARLAPAASSSRPKNTVQKQMIDHVVGSQPYGDRPWTRSTRWAVVYPRQANSPATASPT